MIIRALRTLSIQHPMTEPIHGICPLPHLGVLRVQGSDAAAFLHGQLSQDFVLLDLTQARLAAYCSPKGRMLASFVGFKRSADDIVLICQRDLLAATLKRLQMYVMRAKAKLSDASAEFNVYGLVGDAIKSIATEVHPTWTKLDFDDISVVQLPPTAAGARALWLAPVATPAPAGLVLDAPVWPWLEVMSGVATLSTPVVDAFVPQMLNYESVGGVNFKKGCYPGQEVVARSQFRGTLKRRAFIVHSDVALTAGQEVFAPADAAQAPPQPCGTVVQAAAVPAGHGSGCNAIVSLQLSAAEAGALALGQPQGPQLRLLPLPYALLADI